MNTLRYSVTAYLFALATLTGFAQTSVPSGASPSPSALNSLPAQAPAQINRRVIVIDPAHGGIDSGSQISDTSVEKDVTLALAFRLRAMLTARGFTVVMTRDADTPSEPDITGSALTPDGRAGIANHAHAAACLLLHATGSGNGVHLYSSQLEATAGDPPVVPWLTAQAAWVPQSQLLEKQFAAAFMRAEIPLVTSSASIRPMDSLTCPALVVELAPQSDDADSINDTDYQQRVALAIAGSLLFWQNQVLPPARISAATANYTAPASSSGAQP